MYILSLLQVCVELCLLWSELKHKESHWRSLPKHILLRAGRDPGTSLCCPGPQQVGSETHCLHSHDDNRSILLLYTSVRYYR